MDKLQALLVGVEAEKKLCTKYPESKTTYTHWPNNSTSKNLSLGNNLKFPKYLAMRTRKLESTFIPKGEIWIPVFLL